MLYSSSVVVLSLAIPSLAGHCQKNIQHKFAPGQSAGQEQRAAAVKDAYVRAWNAYATYAFGDDQLQPLTLTPTNPWNHWGVTIVDGLDTAIVMGLTDIVEKQLAFIPTIDFKSSPDELVEIFDINIRYIGGLLSAYDLLHSGDFPNPYNQDHVESLLQQAKTLADGLKHAYDTPTGLPAGDVNFTTMQPVMSIFSYDGQIYNSTNTAQAGTFILEWFRLTDLTGDESYRTIVERSENYLVNPNPPPKYPGLVGTELNTDTGEFLTYDGGWHAGVDSFLEYLIKTYVYNSTMKVTGEYKDFWLKAVQSSKEHIALHPYNFPQTTFLSSLGVQGQIEDTMDDFACFAGGNLLLGGAYLNRPDILNLGVQVTDGCHSTYNTTVTGLGPQQWSWYNQLDLAYDQSADNNPVDRAGAAKVGYFVNDPSWDCRPESIESIFYAWRITGDMRWRDYAWEIFQAVNTTARTSAAYAMVNNVTAPGGGGHSNVLESFFFAEVLKYLYLTFADIDVVSLDNYVFNTECHPFLIQC